MPNQRSRLCTVSGPSCQGNEFVTRPISATQFHRRIGKEDEPLQITTEDGNTTGVFLTPALTKLWSQS